MESFDSSNMLVPWISAFLKIIFDTEINSAGFQISSDFRLFDCWICYWQKSNQNISLMFFVHQFHLIFQESICSLCNLWKICSKGVRAKRKVCGKLNFTWAAVYRLICIYSWCKARMGWSFSNGLIHSVEQKYKQIFN